MAAWVRGVVGWRSRLGWLTATSWCWSSVEAAATVPMMVSRTRSRVRSRTSRLYAIGRSGPGTRWSFVRWRRQSRARARPRDRRTGGLRASGRRRWVIPAAVLARIEAHLAEGDPAGALTIGIRQLDVAGLVRADRLPSGASWSRGLLELAPTIARELRVVDGLGTAVDRYATITAPVLVLLGTVSRPANSGPATTALDAGAQPPVRSAEPERELSSKHGAFRGWVRTAVVGGGDW